MANITQVTTIANLRTISKTQTTSVFVEGYYKSGDGGGGNYYCDLSDTTSKDNGGSIIVAIDGARWKLTQTDTLSIKQFGAKGDFATNDTVAFQSTINAITAQKGGVVQIPHGVYVLDQINLQNTPAMTITGTGQSSVLFFTSTTNDGIKITGSAGYVCLTDFWIVGSDKATAGSMINISSTTNPALLVDNIIINNGFNGILINTPGNDVFINNFLFNSQINAAILDYSGAWITQGNINGAKRYGYLKIDGLGPTISNVDIFGCKIGVQINPPTGKVCAQMRFDAVTCENGDYGYIFGPADGSIASLFLNQCSGTGNKINGILVNGANVNGLTITDFLSGGNLQDGIRVSAGKNIKVMSSTIAGNGGNGILLEGNSSSIHITDNSIGAGSLYVNNTGAGIVINSPVNGYMVINNILNGNKGGTIKDTGGTNKIVKDNLVI